MARRGEAALTARELVREARGEGVGVESHEREELAHTTLDAICGPVLEPRQQSDVGGDGKVGEESHVLNHVADAAPQRRRTGRRCGLARDLHGPARRRE